MKQALHLQLGQQLKMTPQLQQAIRLLQLSTLDLQQEIQEALESNPMLEVNEDSADAPESSAINEQQSEPTNSDSTDEKQEA
ncbi:MAG: RNA polymerase factor sigma-54, partial [Alcanivoracaceae bacterium]